MAQPSKTRSLSRGHWPVAERLETRALLSATYFVSPAGNDTNPGTIDAPFQTIQHAATLAGPGDVVDIRAGTYRETVTPKSGAAGSPVTFQAYNGETVIIDGANAVTGWSGYSSTVDVAAQPWDLGFGNNQVFVDGVSMVEARWPNTTLDLSHPTLATAGLGSSNSTLMDPAAAGVSAAGAVIHITSGSQWVAQSGTVIGQSGGRLTVGLKSMGDPHPGVHPGNTYYLTGKFQYLDAPGEWFRDPSGALYLWAPNGTSGHLVEAKARQYGFNLKGKSNVTILGVQLFACTITSGGSNNIVLNGIGAHYTSQYTILANGWQPPNDGGISLIGNNDQIVNSTIDGSAGDGILLIGNGNVAQNNVVLNTNTFASDASAIRIWGTRNVVDHNTVLYSGRDGVKWSGSTVSQVTYNSISDVMLQATDGGAIYTYGTNGAGSVLAYNRIFNVRSGGWGAAGVYMDNNSRNYTIHNNATWNVDIALKMNPTNFNENVYNNTFYGLSFSINSYGSEDASGSVFTSNVFNAKITLRGRITFANTQSSGDTAGTFFCGSTIGSPLNPVPNFLEVQSKTSLPRYQ